MPGHAGAPPPPPDCSFCTCHVGRLHSAPAWKREVSFEEFMAMLHPKESTRKMSKNKSLHELAEQAFKETAG